MEKQQNAIERRAFRKSSQNSRFLNSKTFTKHFNVKNHNQIHDKKLKHKKQNVHV